MLKVKRLLPDAVLPTVAHPGEDIGYDLYSVEDLTISARGAAGVHTGIAIEFVPAAGGIVKTRSGLAKKRLMCNAGVIDAGYRGEILVCLVNVNQPTYTLVENRDTTGTLRGVTLVKSDVSVHLRKGDKIVQMTPLRASTEWPVVVVENLTESQRGQRGFGSSGR